jgi:acyl-CoA synthetase (AMP-forming)/AMP-acid ligase II
MPVIDFFDRGASLGRTRTAFLAGDEAFSYGDAQDLTIRIAAAIQALSPEPSPHVAVLSPNHPRAFLCVLGALRAGGVWVPVNARNGTEESVFLLRKLDCTLLFYHSALAEQVAQLRRQVPAIRHAICIDRAIPDSLGWDDVTGERRFVAPPVSLRGDPRVSTILSTGGTTGYPKGVVWTDAVWESLVASFWAHMPCDVPPVYLAATPMTHAAGVIAFPLMAGGATSVLLERAEPRAIMAAIEQHRVTHLFLPPTVIYAMLAHPDVRAFDYSSLRHFIYAAAPMSVDKLKEAISVFGPVMAQGYGQAEIPLMATFLSAREHVEILASGDHRRLGSCGRPALLCRVEIISDDGAPLPPETAGEIVMRSSLLMAGYYADPAATEAASAGGWHRTGDIGLKDADGYVYIIDRKKDMIITGGFNVYSVEVERVILQHPAVRDCAVIGVPDELWGEAIKAIVEPKPGQSISPDDIMRQCRDKLGGVKTPKTVEIWEALPRSAVGKVLKREVRQRYWAGTGRVI